MWLETITVRTTSLAHLNAHLPELLDQLYASSPELEIRTYTRFPNSTDLSLHLIHEAGPIKLSVNGLRLAAALADFGIVDHTLWQSASGGSAETGTRV